MSRYSPWIDGLDYTVTTTEQQVNNQEVLDSYSLDDLLPKITVNGVTSNLVAPESCYIDSSNTATGYPVLTSITAVPIDDPTAFSTTCYNQDAYGAGWLMKLKPTSSDALNDLMDPAAYQAFIDTE